METLRAFIPALLLCLSAPILASIMFAYLQWSEKRDWLYVFATVILGIIAVAALLIFGPWTDLYMNFFPTLRVLTAIETMFLALIVLAMQRRLFSREIEGTIVIVPSGWLLLGMSIAVVIELIRWLPFTMFFLIAAGFGANVIGLILDVVWITISILVIWGIMELPSRIAFKHFVNAASIVIPVVAAVLIHMAVVAGGRKLTGAEELERELHRNYWLELTPSALYLLATGLLVMMVRHFTKPPSSRNV